MTLNFLLYNLILKSSYVHIIHYEHRHTQPSPFISLPFLQPCLLLLFQSPSNLCILVFCSGLLQGAIAALCLWFHCLCHKTPTILHTCSLYTPFSVIVLRAWKERYKCPVEAYREIIFFPLIFRAWQKIF